MTLVSKRTVVAASAAAVAALAGGVAIIGSASSSSATESAELVPISVLEAGAPASPADATNVIDSAIAAEYGIGTSTARWVPAPTPNADRPTSGTKTTGRWLVLPGSSGVCVVFPGRDYTCGGRTGRDGGVLILSTKPAPVGPPPATDKAGNPTEKFDPTPGPGPGTIRGLMPDDVVRVAALDENGNHIASTEVRDNVYELRVPQAREMQAVALYDAAGRQLAQY